MAGAWSGHPTPQTSVEPSGFARAAFDLFKSSSKRRASLSVPITVSSPYFLGSLGINYFGKVDIAAVNVIISLLHFLYDCCLEYMKALGI